MITSYPLRMTFGSRQLGEIRMQAFYRAAGSWDEYDPTDKYLYPQGFKYRLYQTRFYFKQVVLYL